MCNYAGILAKNLILSEGKKFTPKVFSAVKTEMPQLAKKRGLVYTKLLVFKGKEGKHHIYAKKPPRCLWGTSSQSIGV